MLNPGPVAPCLPQRSTQLPRMLAEPAPRLPRPRRMPLDQRPELPAVPTDPQVRPLMDRDGVEDEGRREHEAPAEGEGPTDRGAAPAADGVAHGQATGRHRHL